MSGLRDRRRTGIIDDEMKTCFARCLILILLMGTVQSALLPNRAQAMGEDTREVLRGGAYGLIGGTIVGLAVLPLTGSARGVFIGSSLGLYMGILLGVYRVTHREEFEPSAQTDSRGLSTVFNGADDSIESSSVSRFIFHEPSNSPVHTPISEWISFSIPVARF